MHLSLPLARVLQSPQFRTPPPIPMQIPGLSTRLNNLLFTMEAPQQLADVRAILAHHSAAQRELRSSATFAAALQGALALGNFLNHGTRLGAARGFRLRNLRKLSDTRSLDGHSTLLTWLARRLTPLDAPSAPDLAAELPHVASPKLSTPVQDAADALAAVAAGLRAAQAFLAASEEEGVAAGGELGHCASPRPALPDSPLSSGSADSDSDGGHRQRLAASVAAVSGELAAAQAQLRECRESFASLAAYFGEAASSPALEQDFWADVQAFVVQFAVAQAAVRRQHQVQVDRQRRARSVAAGKALMASPVKPPKQAEQVQGAAAAPATKRQLQFWTWT